MKGAFKQISFCSLRDASVAVQITKPLTVNFIMKALIGILVHHLMPACILLITGHQVSEQCSDDRFIMRPPEFHVLPVFLHGFSIHIPEIKYAALFCVPSPLP